MSSVEMEDRIMDAIQAISSKLDVSVTPELLLKVFDNTIANSGLRKFCIMCVVYSFFPKADENEDPELKASAFFTSSF